MKNLTSKTSSWISRSLVKGRDWGNLCRNVRTSTKGTTFTDCEWEQSNSSITLAPFQEPCGSELSDSERYVGRYTGELLSLVFHDGNAHWWWMMSESDGEPRKIPREFWFPVLVVPSNSEFQKQARTEQFPQKFLIQSTPLIRDLSEIWKRSFIGGFPLWAGCVDRYGTGNEMSLSYAVFSYKRVSYI